MPPKKKQKSRSSSLAEIEPQASNSSQMKKADLEEEKKHFTHTTEKNEEIEFEEFRNKLAKPLSRTNLLIQDHLEFKAGRSIQRFVRGWLYRIKYRRKRLAAIRIQAEWRRFYCQRLYFLKVEKMLQQRIEQHFHRAAQRIQAIWRGWWVRHHIHDFTSLKRLQLMGGEDLLYCVAFKLHHLLRTHQIPGVYSLRNSNTFSKVEQLLASLKFKAFNQRSIQLMKALRQEKEEAKKQHKKSAFGTKIPFTGPDINNVCKQKFPPLYNAKDADIRMAKILQLYESAHRELYKPKALQKKSMPKKYNLKPSKPSTFCGDVIQSMKKWKILKENNLSVDANVFKKPQNIQNFLEEIQHKMSFLQVNDYRNYDFSQEVKVKYLSKSQELILSHTNYKEEKSPTSIEGFRSS